MTIYLDEQEVSRLLDMPTALAAVEDVMRMHGQGETIDYPRQRVRLPTSMTHLLQGGIPPLNLTGIKIYTPMLIRNTRASSGNMGSHRRRETALAKAAS